MRDDLGDRMKKYEYITRTHLMPRTPVIIRIDGKAFHTFTRGFKRPFDDVLINSMQDTMMYLCENIQGCVLGYTQSDEITLVLVDYKKLDSSSWFDYNIQKCASVVASMATLQFNKSFKDYVGDYIFFHKDDDCDYCLKLIRARNNGALFDARAFNVPKEEVTNCILWRQNDAIRNSIQMVGQANFLHNKLQNKTSNDIKDMLLTEKSINWDDLPTKYKRGTCCIKHKTVGDSRAKWIIDEEIPIFKNYGRSYIECLINVSEDSHELQKKTAGESDQ